MTRGERTTNPRLQTSDFVKRVFEGVKAILIDRVRHRLERASMTVSDLFTKYDRNKDGFLEYDEFSKAMLECKIDLQKNMRDYLMKECLDPQGASR